jgi:hypothetical protein
MDLSGPGIDVKLKERKKVLSPTHSWLNQDQKLVTSILQKLFERKYSWAATVNPLTVSPALIKLAVPKLQEGVATI